MQYHTVLEGHLEPMFEDTYFDLDAIVPERDSRNFFARMCIVNANAKWGRRLASCALHGVGGVRERRRSDQKGALPEALVLGIPHQDLSMTPI